MPESRQPLCISFSFLFPFALNFCTHSTLHFWFHPFPFWRIILFSTDGNLALVCQRNMEISGQIFSLALNLNPWRGGKNDPSSSLCIQAHGREWWAGYVMCLFQIPSVLAWRPGRLVCVGLGMCVDRVSYLYTGLLLSGNSVGCHLDSIVGY